MQKVKIDSSAIKEVQYLENKNTLIIWFTNKFNKIYFNVPEKVYQDFLNAESKGSFFNQQIKGIYPEG